MDNTAPFTEEERTNLYNKLLNELLAATDSQAIEFEIAQEASEYILANVDDIQDQEDLRFFLERLAEQWPIFQGMTLPSREQQAQAQDQQSIQNIQEQIQQIPQ